MSKQYQVTLTEQEMKHVLSVYQDAADEGERVESIKELADIFGVGVMVIRQVLQDAGLYKKVEGKTEKQQYAAALYAVTLIEEKEWMKLRLDSQKKLMEIFKKGSK